MKKTLSISAVLLAAAIGFQVARTSSVDAAAGQPTKVGYVDLNDTLLKTKAGKAAQAELGKEKADKQKLIDADKAAFKKKVEDLDKKKALLRPEVLAERQAGLQEEYAKLQEKFVGYQQALSKKEASLTDQIFKKAANIIQDIVKRDGYTIMLEKSESAVLFGDPTYNITTEVNKRLDAGEGAK